MIDADRREGKLGIGAQLEEAVEVRRNDRADPRVAAGRLVVAAEDDWGAIAEDLDIADNDRV
jgi:hypothetical protein